MKNAIVRFAALYVFNVALLLAIGLVFPGVSVGFDALWAGIILSLASLFVKPALTALFRRLAARSASERTRTGEKTVQYALVYIVELIIWIGVVAFSGVRASGFWGYAVPPLVLLIGWVIYDQVDDRLRAKAGELCDVVQSKVSGRAARSGAAGSTSTTGSPAASATRPASATGAGRDERDDGLTPEQRRMFDELG